MTASNSSPTRNTAKRLPIVFCLDVSPSMGWKEGSNSSSMDLLNTAVNNFLAELKHDPRAKTSAEIAFVTFSTHIEMDTEFESIGSLQPPRFEPVAEGGTLMAQAVLRSIAKIEDRRKALEELEIPYYAPFLVLVTDGNPDGNDDATLQQRALTAVKDHCNSHTGASEIIVPFVIGVGDYISPKTLTDYSAGFANGYFPIQGAAEKVKVKFNKVFHMISNSTKMSIHLGDKAADILSVLQSDMNDLLRDLASE